MFCIRRRGCPGHCRQRGPECGDFSGRCTVYAYMHPGDITQGYAQGVHVGLGGHLVVLRLSISVEEGRVNVGKREILAQVLLAVKLKKALF